MFWPRRLTTLRESFKEHIVRVTISPNFARFERPYDRMGCCIIVLGRMSIRRVVATADVPADLAEAKMHPTRADLKTFLASIGARCHGNDRSQMFASRHDASLQFSESQNNSTQKRPLGRDRMYQGLFLS